MNILASFIGPTTAHYNAGRVLFYRGRLPLGAHTATDLILRYDTMSRSDQHICDGWFDARDAQRLAYTGTLTASTRAMTPTMQVSPRSLSGRGMPKAPRRKGWDSVSIRCNGAGMVMRWHGMSFKLDDMRDDERAYVVTNALTGSVHSR